MHRHPLADHGDGRAALAHASYGTDPLCPRQPPDTVGVTHDGMRRMRTRTQAFNMGKAECRGANSNSVLQVRCIAALRGPPWLSAFFVLKACLLTVRTAARRISLDEPGTCGQCVRGSALSSSSGKRRWERCRGGG